MTRELRRLSIIMVVMFFGLFGATSWIQVVQAQTLAENPENRRTLYDSFEVQRGSIIAGDEVIASSVPSDDIYSWQRQYADAPMWAPVTGYINPVLQSATGIEQAMNRELSGAASSQFLSRVDQIITGQPPRGSNVLLTLDPALQRVATEALGSYQGAVVAIEPSTGRVLAMVTSPSYDTNTLAVHDSAAVNTTYDELLNAAVDPLANRTIDTLNPPGSTFKLVVASAALASGKFTPDSTFANPSSYVLPGTSTAIHNFDGNTCGPGDQVSLATALRLSCNIPMAQLAVALGDDAIRDEAKKYGFNTRFDIPLAVSASNYPEGSLSDDQTAQTGYGQLDVKATPLQIAMVSAGIANHGIVMNPRMVDRVVAPDLTVQQTFENTEFGRALSEQDAATMTSLMIANVSNGAASGARIEGVDVAGKTGTAEHGPGDPYTLWFTGFAPADDPTVAVAVMIEDGGGLGQSGTSNGIAAPIAKKVIEAVLSR
ncbi:peptidoglycan D,D-transpeptidase FtsI family protein [Microbacterium lacticum]|uniref:Cell elongation-specific peptidoglycan D,D-transpeptidase n=1 Tax=Microbacterium lacticum TaxID=33885 RepID=A0A4Y3UJG8_9MICO|nr:penicillin-binding protein 2 [Microbacterium lacticum]TQM97841.1 cell elongation-specific peptidoglycan D,D-transpeptidase [Microbacterium lacticum]GEB94214.1 cell division protein FtsI [Microbacterium lacticum]GGN15505.1 cell division protein FtsI [Microbacterium lacticum]